MGGTWRIEAGDCREVLARLPDESVDSVVTDPPYELGFMGKTWDRSGIAYDVDVWREVKRVLKPGANLLAFSSSRTYHRMAVAIEDAGFEIRDQIQWLYGSGFPKHRSHLKTAHEPIALARKPGKGTLNVEACRVGTGSTLRTAGRTVLGLMNDDGWQPKPQTNGSTCGRWPANVILDEAAAAVLDAQSGISTSRVGMRGERRGNVYNHPDGPNTMRGHTDTGGASRFFYVAKAASGERHAGTERNTHATVKPLTLMRHLVRLATPPGGLVLDPFTGSGTTGCAAVLEGMDFTGIEREPEYVAIAEARIAHWAEQAQQLPLEAR